MCLEELIQYICDAVYADFSTGDPEPKHLAS